MYETDQRCDAIQCICADGFIEGYLISRVGCVGIEIFSDPTSIKKRITECLLEKRYL